MRKPEQRRDRSAYTCWGSGLSTRARTYGRMASRSRALRAWQARTRRACAYAARARTAVSRRNKASLSGLGAAPRERHRPRTCASYRAVRRCFPALPPPVPAPCRISGNSPVGCCALPDASGRCTPPRQVLLGRPAPAPCRTSDRIRSRRAKSPDASGRCTGGPSAPRVRARAQPRTSPGLPGIWTRNACCRRNTSCRGNQRCLRFSQGRQSCRKPGRSPSSIILHIGSPRIAASK